MTPSDQAARDRFIRECDINFSVQAAAGAGKTTALVDRVVSLARQHPKRLETVVLVTYTHRAADEMRQRLRAALMETKEIDFSVLMRGLSRMFIGTIHSFCLRLIRDHALALGYPVEASPAPTDDRPLFDRWRHQRTARPLSKWEVLLHRFLPVRDIESLARSAAQQTVDWRPLADQWLLEAEQTALPATLDGHTLDEVTSSNAKAKKTIERFQLLWRRIAEAFANESESHLIMPLYDGKGGGVMQSAWPETVGPLMDLLLGLARAAVAREAADFQEFRFCESQLTYADQIVLAHRLLKNEDVRRRLREREYRILLDEAQDTDPLQFELLVELTRPVSSGFRDWELTGVACRAGHFSMVGDAQQSIYRDRAHLPTYLKWHQLLSASTAGEALTFTQTFRCRPSVVEWVNHRFSGVLTGQGGQVDYAPLIARPGVELGQVVCWKTPGALALETYPSISIARWLAEQIQRTGPKRLRARSWKEVAVLCPARAWLRDIFKACQQIGLPAQLHFEEAVQTDPAYSWLAGLAAVIADPHNEFELIGVLREIYGISDDEICHSKFPHDNRHYVVSLHIGMKGATPSVQCALDELAVAIESSVDFTPARQLARIAKQIHLSQRLRVATGSEVAELSVARLLDQWVARETASVSLAVFALSLREQMGASAATMPPSSQPCVQLMTLKKAKGLQWDAVILPFLGKTFVEGADRFYPRIDFPVGREQDVTLAMKSGVVSTRWEEEKERDKREQELEFQRLYYVGCTRPRHTLVMVDDSNVWTKMLKSGPKLPGPCALDALQKENEARDAEEILRSGPLADELTADDSIKSEKETFLPDGDMSALDFEVEASKERLTITKQTPSGLKDGSPTLLSDEEPGNAILAAAYGTWWHETMERYPWREKLDIVKSYHRAAIDRLKFIAADYCERAKAELEMLERSSLRSELAGVESQCVYAEIPFSRRIGEAAIEDGQIDLIFEHAPGEWTLVDWKTDRPKMGMVHADYLKWRYSAQLVAYAEACSTAKVVVTRSIIYGVSTGEIILLPETKKSGSV